MITLESAKLAFDTWRATKSNNNTPTPVKLWDMVKDLLLTHKRGELCEVLRISGNQIKKHCTVIPISQHKKRRALQVSGNHFVEAIPALTPPGMSELTLKGHSKSLHLCLPTSALREVLPVLGALL